jgi:membrane-associated phospholipid phosphatase
VFAPAVLIAVLLVAVGRWWGVVAALFCSVIPFGYIVLGVLRGRLTDHHIDLREQRRIPLAFGIASVLTGLALLAAFRAPRDLVALVAAGAVGLAVCAAVSQWWKMSIHTAVAAGTVVILVLVYGPRWWTSLLVLTAIGWSRVRLGAHTVAQVLVGAVVGATIAASVFTALR